MKALHCDACDTWTPENSHPAREFYTLTSGDWQRHFCTLDCCMRWAAANSEPTEEVTLGA